MYILKNAWRNVRRNAGKNVLLGCIALVIGLSSCLALSIRQAASKEKSSGLDDLTITASIGVDRMSMMKERKQQDTQSNQEMPDMKEMFSNMQSLSLDELQTYAKADSVKSFYYTETLSLNGSGLEAIETQTNDTGGMQRGMPEGMQSMNQGDFTVIGYSSYEAMSDFENGNATISKGEVFAKDAVDTCMIHEELAEYNDLALGDTITFVNPNNEKESYALKIVGTYTSDTTSANQMPMMRSDPANQIYVSYAALASIEAASTKTNSDEDNVLQGNLQGTYVFEDIASYESFDQQARDLGLSEEYTITSQDLNAYEQSLQPLENLSNYATIFLIVILLIGGAILIVLHLYHIRERKYEIGVLAAIGMNKKKISTQFISEIFIVTVIAMLLGTGIGAVVSVPVTNTLLESTASSSDTKHGGFGKEMGEDVPDKEDMPEGFMGMGKQYISEISSATDGIVIGEVCLVALLLTIFSGGIAVMSILRYEPLKILSNRE